MGRGSDQAPLVKQGVCWHPMGFWPARFLVTIPARNYFNHWMKPGRKHCNLPACPMKSTVREALDQSGFKNPRVDSEQIKIEFKDMHELIAWLKIYRGQ